MLPTSTSFATPNTNFDESLTVWEQLAPLIAGRPRMRVSRDKGKSYPQRSERDLGKLPVQPTAVMLHDAKTGLANVLVFDLDMPKAHTCKDPKLQIDKDFARIIKLLSHFELKWIHDTSPSGGHHLYVPIEGGVSSAEAYSFLALLKTVCPTIDPLPHVTIQHGCIRPPGSVHKFGGHQELVMSLKMALEVAGNPAPRNNFDAMVAYVEQIRPEPVEPASEPAPSILDKEARGVISKSALNIVRDGRTENYHSPSEARFAALRAATNIGMDYTAIFTRMSDGRWPGLATLFSRYKNPAKELRKELERLKNKGHRPGDSAVHKNNTSQLKAQGATTQSSNVGFYEWLKQWRNAMHYSERSLSSHRDSLGLRLTLRAIGEAASKAQTTVIEFGCRALALATGLDYTTVSRHLKTLRDAPEPLITLVEHARGKDADSYELLIPQSMVEEASASRYRKGKLHALRPVFRALGINAAFIYEAIEAGARTVQGIIVETGLSKSAVHESLGILEAHRLIEKQGSTWSLLNANLTHLAEQLGATDAVAHQRAQYALQRGIWIIWLTTRRSTVLISHDEDYPFEMFEPPPPAPGEIPADFY